MLGVRVETLRRWEREEAQHDPYGGWPAHGRCLEVARLLAEGRERPKITSASVRNRFAGTVTEVKRDKLAATVEILAGPHRILAFVTREAVDEMRLHPG